MTATAINATARFFARGVSKCYFLTTVADLATGPTRTELDAGQDLTPEIADLDGWLVEGEDIETPDLGTEFTSKIPGPTSVDDSSITFYADATGDDDGDQVKDIRSGDQASADPATWTPPADDLRPHIVTTG